jgi:multidrug efflux pump subunit AcrB
VAIPLSIVATFMLLFFTNQTLNVFTLGGLALGVGRLVDDSIVELENIHRHLGRGQNRKQAVLAGRAGSRDADFGVDHHDHRRVLAGAFHERHRTLLVPAAGAHHLVRTDHEFLGLANRDATSVLLLAQGRSRTSNDRKGIAAVITGFFDRRRCGLCRNLALGALASFVDCPGIVAFFFGSLQLKRFIGSEFFPDTDESQFTITYKSPIGTRVERSEQVTQQLEKIVQDQLAPLRIDGKETPIYTTVLSDVGLPIGRTAIFSTNTGTHSGNLQANLVPRGERPFSDVVAAEKVRAALKNAVPGTQWFFFVGGIVKRIQNFGATAPIDVEILGYDFDAGSEYGKRLMDKMRGLTDAQGRPLVVDIQSSREENSPEFDVNVDREKAGMLGVSEQDVAQTILIGLLGNTQITPVPYTDPKTGNEYYINVRMGDNDREHIADLGDMFVRTPANGIVNVDTLARIERRSGPVMIDRKYLQRIVHVTANIAPDSDLGTASQAVQGVVDQLQPPDGFSATLGGQTLEQKKAFEGLIFAAIMALLLVYMVLASQFKSLIDPLVIMFSVPLGVSGVFIMLFLTGTKLSVNSFMGIIMMVGIVVSNGVLLVDFANVLRGRGKSLVEATIEAGRTRLRPILMTTIATVLGLIPMALGIGEGSETNLPLARAVIGGLLVSTFFTLFLVPSLYTVLDRFAKRRAPHEDDDQDEERVHA